MIHFCLCEYILSHSCSSAKLSMKLSNFVIDVAYGIGFVVFAPVHKGLSCAYNRPLCLSGITFSHRELLALLHRLLDEAMSLLQRSLFHFLGWPEKVGMRQNILKQCSHYFRLFLSCKRTYLPRTAFVLGWSVPSTCSRIDKARWKSGSACSYLP